jgi:hypothetical protein
MGISSKPRRQKPPVSVGRYCNRSSTCSRHRTTGAWDKIVLCTLGQSLKGPKIVNEETPFFRYRRVAVRSYLQAILNYLQEKEYSACALEVVTGGI